MTNITSLKTSLKTLPLITILTIGLALAPINSMAGNADRGHQKSGHVKHSAKNHDKGHYSSQKYIHRSANKSHRSGVSHALKHRKNASYGDIHNRGYYKRGRHYDHRYYYPTHYVTNNHDHGGHFFDIDHLRFMIGLHTDNFDITFRD